MNFIVIINEINGFVLFDEIILFLFLIVFLIKLINSFSYYNFNYKYLTIESLIDLLILLFFLLDLNLFQYFLQNIDLQNIDSWLINLLIFTTFNCPYYLLISKLLIIISLIIVIIFSINFLLETINNYLEYSFLLIFFILSSFFFLSSFDLISMYLSLEGISLTLYILIALNYVNNASLEASIKYFFLGILSSSFIIYGISIIYGIFGFTNFLKLKEFLSFIDFNKGKIDIELKFLIEFNNINYDCIMINYNLILIKISLIFLLFGFFFKLSTFPCSLWIPDIYEGSQLFITFFLSTTVKMVIFLFFFRLFFFTFSIFYSFIYPFILISAFGSIILGNFGAILQKRIKRFIAYTSVFQIGFMLLGLSSNTVQSFQSFLIYLIFYFISNIILFGILLHVKCFITNINLNTIFDLKNLYIYNSLYSIFFSIAILSIAGIPPIAGFFSKYLILLSFFGNTYYFLTLFLFFVNGISIFYYLRLLKNIFFEIKNWSEFFYSNKLFLFYSFVLEVNLILFFCIFFLIFFPIIGFNILINFCTIFIESII